jgi:hypothetical protein
MDAKWRLKSVSCDRVNLKQRSATYHATSCPSGLWRDRTLERHSRAADSVSVSRVNAFI